MSVPTAHRPLVGLLPAAGMGRRLGRYGFAKELFPIVEAQGADTPLEPRPVCDYALADLAAAGAERCLVAVAPHKLELLRFLEGSRRGMALAYLVQAEPQGLPHVVRLARPWLGDADVALALPDTLVFPGDALAAVRAEVARGADLALGVFPVDEPERLGPVDIAPDGAVRRVFDKPATRAIANSWGCAVWTPRFTDFCSRWDEAAPAGGERVLGHAFEAARAAGMAVRACFFPDGKMLDIGTPRGLDLALAALRGAR